MPTAIAAPIPAPAPMPVSKPKIIGEGKNTWFSYRLLDNGAEEYAEIIRYERWEASVKIPAELEGRPVRSIGANAFYSSQPLTLIDIPASVTSIGDRAFSECRSLSAVNIPASVTSIGDYAFSRGTSLTSLSIPSSVTKIGNRAFSDCYSITSIFIPSSVTSIGERAFSRCPNLTLTVSSGSFAEQYAQKNNIPYTTAATEMSSPIPASTPIVDLKIKDSGAEQHEALSVILDLDKRSVKAGESLTASWTAVGGVGPYAVKEVLWVQLDKYGDFLDQTVGDVESNNGMWTSVFVHPGPRGSCAVYMVDALGQEFGIAITFIVE